MGREVLLLVGRFRLLGSGTVVLRIGVAERELIDGASEVTEQNNVLLSLSLSTLLGETDDETLHVCQFTTQRANEFFQRCVQARLLRLRRVRGVIQWGRHGGEGGGKWERPWIAAFWRGGDGGGRKGGWRFRMLTRSLI